MLSKKNPRSIVGLDIEAGSAAATEVRVNGAIEVLKHGVISLGPGVFSEGEVVDAGGLAEALKELFAKNKLSRNVRLGIANQRVAVRVLRLPPLDGKELESAIRFQAQDHIPMPLDQAMLDWQVIDRVEGEPGQGHVDVVAVAARRDMLATMLDVLRRAGLRPVGIDHAAFGMIRALGGSELAAVEAPAPAVPDLGAEQLPPAPDLGAEQIPPAPDLGAEQVPPAAPTAMPDTPVAPAGETMPPAAVPAETSAPDQASAPQTGKLYCSLADATNLAVVQQGACRFTRVSPFGVEAIAQRLAEREQCSLDEAHGWLLRVGLDADPQQLEGEPTRIAAAREALNEGAAKLADELRMSLDYYGAQENAIPVDGIVACGRGTTIPGLLARLQQEVGRPFEVARPAALGGVDETAAARLTLPYGIALEE